MSEENLNFKILKLLLTHNNDAIVTIDHEGIVQYQSPSCKQLLGYEDDELVGTQGTDYYHPDDMPMFGLKLEECLSNPEKPIFYPGRVKHKDGYFMWCEGTMTNFLENKDAQCIIGNFRDISEKKTFIEELDLRISQLKKISWIQSHLIRSPLTNILGIVSLLGDEHNVDENTKKEIIDMLKVSANQLDEVIRKTVNLANEIDI